MSEQSTDYGRFAAISEQRQQFETLLYLVKTFPHLPAAYITCNAFEGLGLGLRLETSAEAEAWRTALDVPAADVTLHRYTGYTTIEFRTVLFGVPVAVYGATPLTPDRASISPAQARAAAALIEQRHQAEDAAVPPLAVTDEQVTEPPAAPVEVRTLADAQGGAL